ncbi:hypothetical protein ENSA5_52770 [Enhygromyxa salina]|uniref:Uncharacterized protein n=1 Tax=Enhygromyxa salina TaxID=215803 RepID=A0A2S9XG42_9BACT|nr:hypothetical protein [Enhygromyxa salina]PRP91839.1 hypothetical protein ENSA5_52770 [Enhygromyxa salina]
MSEPAETPAQGQPPGSPDNPEDVMAETRVMLRRVSLAVLAFFVVAVVIFWLGWVRAPSPEQICKHKIELVVETAGQQQDEGADALIGQLEAKCVAAARRKIQFRGKLVYAKYAKCVIAATTLAEAERC